VVSPHGNLHVCSVSGALGPVSSLEITQNP
jgi:hypothetical protein